LVPAAPCRWSLPRHPSDAAFKLSLDRLEPLRSADGPSTGKLTPKDILFVLHPEAMAVAVVTFRGKP